MTWKLVYTKQAQKDAKAEEYNQEEPEIFEKQNKKDDDIPF